MKTIIIDGIEYVPKNNNSSTIQKREDLEWGELADRIMKWHEAMKWAKKKGDGWRAPTFGELYEAYEKKVPGFGTGNHWSSTEYSDSNARYVNFSDGSAFSNNKSSSDSVRLVRDIN